MVREGEVHALMGPNGAGKSTLANVVMGHPGYVVTGGSVLLRGARPGRRRPPTSGPAWGSSSPSSTPRRSAGSRSIQFLRQAVAARKGLDELSVLEVRLDLVEWMDRLGMDRAFAERHLNEGFSGGERKRNEILQMAMLEPDLALLDETDSGLDIDALRVVAHGVRTVRERRPEMGALIVTHYATLLEELVPDEVHVLVDGEIVESGDADLARRIERDGYDAWRRVAP